MDLLVTFQKEYNNVIVLLHNEVGLIVNLQIQFLVEQPTLFIKYSASTPNNRLDQLRARIFEPALWAR